MTGLVRTSRAICSTFLRAASSERPLRSRTDLISESLRVEDALRRLVAIRDTSRSVFGLAVRACPILFRVVARLVVHVDGFPPLFPAHGAKRRLIVAEPVERLLELQLGIEP